MTFQQGHELGVSEEDGWGREGIVCRKIMLKLCGPEGGDQATWGRQGAGGNEAARCRAPGGLLRWEDASQGKRRYKRMLRSKQLARAALEEGLAGGRTDWRRDPRGDRALRGAVSCGDVAP